MIQDLDMLCVHLLRGPMFLPLMLPPKGSASFSFVFVVDVAVVQVA